MIPSFGDGVARLKRNVFLTETRDAAVRQFINQPIKIKLIANFCCFSLAFMIAMKNFWDFGVLIEQKKSHTKTSTLAFLTFHFAINHEMNL